MVVFMDISTAELKEPLFKFLDINIDSLLISTVFMRKCNAPVNITMGALF